MAAETGLSCSTVGRIWRAFNLKLHLVETFKLSADPLFVEKVRDGVGLYLDPPQWALVLCHEERHPGASVALSRCVDRRWRGAGSGRRSWSR
jgi:hypothetical protein